MNRQAATGSLSRLAELRDREVNRLNAELVARRSVRARYLDNITRMDDMYAASGPSGALSMALSGNCAEYKLAVLQMADIHRHDMMLYEADMAVAQRALTGAVRRSEALSTLLAQRQASLLREQAMREQKSQDDLAVQMWSRQRR